MTATDQPGVPLADEAGGTADLLANIGNPILRDRIAAAIADGSARLRRPRPRRSGDGPAGLASTPADPRPILTTVHGSYRFTYRLDMTRGRVRYEVDRVGVFWLAPDRNAYLNEYDRRQDYVYIQYGDDVGDSGISEWEADRGERLRPDAPRFYGVSVSGGAYANWRTFGKDKSSHNPWSLHVSRPAVSSYGRRCGASAPGGVTTRCAQVVAALLDHYGGLPERETLRHAQNVCKAPSRLADHLRVIAKLEEVIAEKTLELEKYKELAAAQWALLPEDHPRKRPEEAQDVEV